ncbi:hypothetical protein [Lysinibacillus xylanilyticus]|uniref:hypothetical protein n=1 Tax=Lysinibacillus xylanilyticus TaxID=582475 RepID=UPI0036DE9073
MNIKNEKKDEKKDENYDYIPEASRFTLAILLATLLIWAIYDSFKTGNTGFQWTLVSGTIIVYILTKQYLIRKNSKKRKKNNE